LFSQKRNHQGGAVKMKVRVNEDVGINFKSKVTRWLGVFLDGKHNFQHNHNIIMAKARKAQGEVRTITGKLGLKPENGKKIQIAAVQCVALYGAELW
jgi:hypothetical protein